MEKYLLIEPHTHATELMLYEKDKKINFRDYQEELSSTYSDIVLYEVDETYYEDENPKKEKIATISGRYFDIVYALNNEVSLYDVFDMPDADSASLIPYLLDEDEQLKEEYFTFCDNIYYLDRITVEEKYREQGYASFLLNNLKEILMYLSKLSVGIIIVQAQPFDIVKSKEKMDYDNKERLERLIKLYENAGFKRIGNSKYLILINE